jgi:hypothetical protein
VDLVRDLTATAWNTLGDVAPIVLVLVFFQKAVLRRPLPNPRRIGIGILYVMIGITLFLVGLNEALFPIGRTMARQLTSPTFVDGATDAWETHVWVYLFAASIGFATTLAEPALIAVARKAEAVSGGTVPALGLRLAVACGASLGVAFGCFRIVTGTPLPYYIATAYVLVILQTAIAPRSIVPLAYDSGGVTTSTVTVPVVTALGLGLASSIPGRSPLLDGFGLVAFTCMCPIMSVLAYASLARVLGRSGGGARGKGLKDEPEADRRLDRS